MADNVQFILDRLAETFQMMRDIQVFTEHEVKSIVKKMTDFEYMMVRPVLEISDIQRYLQYVMQLFELQNLRVSNFSKDEYQEKKAVVSKLRKKVIRHIHYIFLRSTRKFPNHHTLWQQNIDFLQKNNSTGLLNALFGKVLSLFPKFEHYWLQAVSYELSTNMNSHMARVLLQRSLRVNPKSQALWIKYFEMEIWYILKIEQRQAILAIDETATVKLFEAPFIIFSHALEAFPSDVQFAVEFYRVSLQTTGYTLMRRIEKSLIEHLGKQPLLWKELSMANISLLDKLNSSSDLKTEYPQLSNLLVAMLGCSEYALSLLEEGYQAIESQHYDEFAIMVDEVGEHFLDQAMVFLSRIPAAYGEDTSSLGDVLNSWQNLLRRLLTMCSNFPTKNDAFTFRNVRLGIHRISTALGLNDFESTSPVFIAKEVLMRLSGLSTLAKTREVGPSSGFSCQALLRILNSMLRILADSRSELLSTSIKEISESIIRLGSTVFAVTPGGLELITRCIEIFIEISTFQSTSFEIIDTVLQGVMASRNTRQEDRISWCVFYLKLQLVSPEGNILSVYDWMERTFQANPFLTTDLDLSEMYEVVLQHCISEGNRDAFKRVVQRAVEICPLNKAFWNHYERVLREEGDHKGANHVRWLASRAN